MLKLRTLITLAAVAAAALAPSANATVSGRIGSFSSVQVTCMGNRIIVTGPSMAPAYDYLWINGGFVLNPSQQVGYRAHVAKAVGGRWVYSSSGPWVNAWVTGQSGALATTTFRITQPGRYAVYAEYAWYANQHWPHSGYAGPYWAAFVADFNAGGYMGWGDPYCG